MAVLEGRMLLARTIPPALVALDAPAQFEKAAEIGTHPMSLDAIPSSVTYQADIPRGQSLFPAARRRHNRVRRRLVCSATARMRTDACNIQPYDRRAAAVAVCLHRCVQPRRHAKSVHLDDVGVGDTKRPGRLQCRSDAACTWRSDRCKRLGAAWRLS
jgi:hypothetical protein